MAKTMYIPNTYKAFLGVFKSPYIFRAKYEY